METEASTLTEPFLSMEAGTTTDVELEEGGPELLVEAETAPTVSEEDVKSAQRQVFLFMQRRKRQRALYGSYSKQSSLVAVIFVVFFIFVLAAFSFITRTRTGNIQIKVRDLVPLFGTLIVVLAIINTVALSLLKEFLTWMFIYIPLIFVSSYFTIMGDKDTLTIRNGAGLGIFLSFCVLEALVFLIGMLTIFIVPAIIDSECFSQSKNLLECYWSTKFGSDNGWKVSYKDKSCQKPCTWIYKGETNDKGLPHGLGLYIDHSTRGETIRGKWQDGRPVAPFTSAINKTGSSSRAVSIIFVQAGDDELDENNPRITHTKPIRMGIASVECSVQGQFLKFLPAFDIVYGPEEWKENSMKDCLEFLRHQPHVIPKTLASVTVSVDHENGLTVAGHEHNNDDSSSQTDNRDHVTIRTERNFQSPYLSVQDWKLTTQKDALIIFPGFNSSVLKGCEMWSQFLSMTTLCQRVEPIYFGWPNGNISRYWEASHKGGCGHTTRERLAEILDGLHANGIRRVHLISHSMGVQPLLSAFQNKDDGSPSDIALRFKSQTSERTSADSTARDLLKCCTITLLNPDFPIAAFKDHAFASIREICNCITLVGDHNDTPLFFSQKCNNALNYLYCGKKNLFPPLLLSSNRRQSFASLGSNFHLLYRHIDEKISDESIHTESDESTGVPENKLLQQAKIFRPSIQWISDLNFPYSFLGSDEVSQHDDMKEWYDIDVIDTTSLDTNIKGLRHSSFQMNPIMLNDMEELIMTGQRASRRQTLVHRSGNMYSYCHAPSHVAM